MPSDLCYFCQRFMAAHLSDALHHLTFVQSFHSLLRRYEKSITRRVSYNDQRLAYTNNDELIILSSRLPPRDNPVRALSYPWLSELRCRSTIIDFLANHNITQMVDHTNDWPTLDVPKAELQCRLDLFKRKAFLLLYRLADCAVGLDRTGNIRARQSLFLDNLLTKALLFSEHRNNDVLLASISESSYFYSPNSVPYNDTMNDNWIRECMCVFEDRMYFQI